MSTEPIVLTRHTLTRCGNRFEFQINADGTGVCIDKDGDPECTVPFSVALKEYRRNALSASLEGNTEFFEDFFDELFDDEIKHQLEDELFEDEAPSEDPIEFLRGSRKDLDKEATLVLQAFPELFTKSGDGDKLWVAFTSNFDDGCASEVRLEHEEINPEGEAWEELLAEVSCRNEFTGFEFVYNDGNSDRMSGYSQSGLEIHFEVDRPSTEETAAARKALIELKIAEPDDFAAKPNEPV